MLKLINKIPSLTKTVVMLFIASNITFALPTATMADTPTQATTDPTAQNNTQNAVETKTHKPIRVFSTESSYDDAKEDLLTSIEDNGLVISYTAHAKAMFDRTKAVTGQKTPVYDNADIILFCKADLSYDLVKKDPHNLVLCPYAIAIYVLHAEPNRVYLSFREQDKSQAVTKPISDLLESIIKDVL